MNTQSFPRSLYFHLAVLVIFAYPFSIPFCSLSIGLWTLSWIWVIASGSGNKPVWGWLILMISLPLMYVIGLVYTANTAYGIFSIEKRAALFVVPLVISTVTWDKELIKRFFLFAYLSALLAAIYCTAIATYNYIWLGKITFFWVDLTSPLGFHPGYFSFFITFLTIWFLRELIFTWNTRSVTFQTSAVISVIFLSVFLIFLASRVHLFLFYATLFLGSLTVFRKSGLILKIAVLAFFIASSFFIWNTLIKERIRNISSVTYKLNDPPEKFNELTIRLALIECSWKVIRNNWVLGVGTGDSYDELEKVYRNADYQFGYLNQQEPHNEYLNTFIAIGLPGLVLLIANFGLSFWLAASRRDLIHFLFILFFSIGCLFESMLSQQKGIVLFAIFNSLFVFQGNAEIRSPRLG